ncbi:RCC1 domain-containing protein [Hymenobacter guriensis]|uniref:IPT/TIG domain-containing protein n=1 Tax=Hymenobacter guriensis TaxID=2793065 RepID=A0ABS0L271_9BACT|nr:IPT/TIG domain-containing protein [Hymenobacter guriensis]MBG8554194.1 IPT/TIG domain-containing protein [Hymenobacter guriensis]
MTNFSSLLRLITSRRPALTVQVYRAVLLLLLLVVPLLGRAQGISFSPTSGSTGTSVVITGSNFNNTGIVSFPGALGTPIGVNKRDFVVHTTTQITLRVPAGALSGPIIITDINPVNGVSTSYSTATEFITDNHLIGSGGITVCSGNLYDDGGPTYGYNYNHDYSTTISPATAGSKVKLYFTQFDIDPYDAVLYIYDGPDFNAPLIGQYAGTNSPGAVAATTPSGELTIRLASAATGYSTLRPGFVATISCAAGVPTISSFTPTNGAAGTSVVITGTDFTGTTAVRFNGTAAAGFVVNSSTQITVPVPAGATSGPITVTNGNGTGSSSVFTTDKTLVGVSPITTCSGSIYDAAENYTYYGTVLMPPRNFRTTTISPATVGGKVRLTFTQFDASQGNGSITGPGYVAVYDGPDTNSPLIGQYTGTTNPGTVTATNPTGQLTIRLFRYLPTSPGPPILPMFSASITCFLGVPYISSFTPASGEAGDNVVLTGLNFTGTTAVRFNGVLATNVTVNSATQITVRVPVGTTNGRITVTNGIGTGSSPTNFTLAPPLISSFTPTSGTAGTEVSFTGRFFTNITGVTFNGVAAASFAVNSSTLMKATVPVGATTGPISVTNANGTGTSTTNFTLPAPTISSFTPTSGVVGDNVVITGTSFFQVSAVRFNGLAAPGFVVNSGTQITVPVPAGATSGVITVTTPSGTGTSADNFSILSPLISSFTPSSGASGTGVVITGSNFTGTTAVRFNGLTASSFVVNSSTQITVPVPTGAISGAIAVTTPSGTGTSADSFTTNNYWMAPAAITTCSGTLYDNGGPGNMVSSPGQTITLSPATAGAKVRLRFTQFALGPASNSLDIFDGPDANAPLIGHYSQASPGTVTAANATGQLTVRSSDNSATGYAGFAATITCVTPTLSSFTPTSGAAGTSVVITGTEFTNATAVRFNGVLAPGFVVNSDTQITVPVPAGNANGLISVTAPFGTATSTASFNVLLPTLTAVSPFIGVPGSIVTLTGTNLTGTSSITFFGSAGQRTVSTGFSVNAAGTQITGVLVPAGAQTGPITATTGGGITPAGAALFSRASIVAAGGSHTVAVRPDGSLWAWGDNASGQLGLSATGGQQPNPVRVGTATNWVSAAAGSGHTVAVRADGSLWAWGSNGSGQLGLGSSTSQDTPQQVGTGTSWASVSAGGGHTIAVRADGSLWAWGDNGNGQLGLGNTNSGYTSPTQIGTATNWVSAAAGGSHTAAVQVDGSLWAWGNNDQGQLGLNNISSQTSPQQVGTVTNWASVAAGDSHTVAVRADGSLWAWGSNGSGQLGLGNSTSQNTPQQMGTGTSWMSAATGDAHTLAVQTDGSLWAWGSNVNGQLGLGNTTNRTTPHYLGGLTSWLSAAAGGNHSAGEQSCGAVWAWGLNGSGQVGDGSITQRTSPVLIINPISLLSFTPTAAGAGSPVTVTGTNLAGLTVLTVNGADALASVTNSTSTGFTFVVPAGALLGAGTVSVAAGCGAGSSTAFTVGPPTPILNALSRDAELPGQAVVLTGLNFTGTSTVSFGGVPAASVTYTSPTSLTAVVPVAATPGSSAVVVTTATGSSPNSPAFEVLQVYRGTAASGCLSTTSLTVTGSGGAGTWRYLRLAGAGGAVVAALEDTRNLGTVTAGFTALGTATGTPVRTDGSSAYLDRNFYLTATNKTFPGQAVRVRFFGLSSELARLTAVDANATLAGLKASQYSGYNENCTLFDNDSNGESRLLAVSATELSGADWFTAEVSVPDHLSEFYLTGATTPLLGISPAPVLVNVSPARNLPTAQLGANVDLSFSLPILATTAGNVRVFGSQRGGQLVHGGNASASGSTITVNPARSFAPGERVMVTVPTTVQGTSGLGTAAKVFEFTAETGQAPATFLDPATSYAMQAQSQSVAVGDLNGDGVLDVVTTDFYGGTNASGSAVVRFGLGNGLLGDPIEINGTFPTAITLGDVDGDGDLDLVTSGATNSNGSVQNQVYRRLNNGSGSFGNSQATQVSTRPTHTVLGDLDGDGDLDMLTAATQASLSFYTNGTFTQTANYFSMGTFQAPIVAVDVALGDVDGDGDLDALIANGSQVSVRLNSGSGVFSGTYDVPMGRAMTKLVVGDVDGDGDLDLATSSSATSTVSVRLNNGNGTFGGGADHLLDFAPNTLTLGDVDGDGDLDLVTAGDNSNLSGAAVGQAVVRLNNGSGAFNSSSTVGTGGSKPFVALGDMDGDGTLDLLTSHAGNSRGNVTGNIGDMAYDYAQLFIRFNTALPSTIAGFSPLSGPAGTLVTITGTNLNTVRGVRFGGSSELAPITAQSATSLTVQVPVGAASGVLTLTTSNGVVLTTATAFTYTPRPAGLLATLSPAGPLEVCAPLTLTGTATSPAFTVGTGLNSNVNGIVVRPYGKLLLVGPFTTYDGVAVNGILQLNPDGSRDAAFDTGTGTTGGFTGTVNAVALQADGKVLVGGDFTMYNGTAATRIIRLNANGTRDETFVTGTGFSAAVQSIVVQPDGQILVGGSFTAYNSTTTIDNRIIRLNPNGSRDVSFDTGGDDYYYNNNNTGGFNSTVQSIVVQADGKVLVGGSFSSYNSATGLGGIVRLTANGIRDTDFATGTGFNNTVNSLALQANGKVLVGGTFSSYNGTANPNLGGIIRLTDNGTRDPDFVTGTGFTTSTNTTATVNVVALQADGKVLVGGQFVNYKGLPQNRIARLETGGTLDATFNIGTGFDVGVRRLAVQPDGSVVAGGNFTRYQDSPAGHLIRLLPDGTPNTTPTPVGGASFTFLPGNTTANPLVTSTPGDYAAVASLNGETSAPSNTVTIVPCTSPPALVTLSTAAELPGLPITITGTGFTPGTTVTFGGVAASSVIVNSLTSLTAVVPAGATAGTSPIVATSLVGGNSLTAPAFQVLGVYEGGALDACTAAVPPTPSINDDAWHYLLAGNGQVVAAYRYTGAPLGNLSIDVGRATPASVVRQDASMGSYLDRNFHLTASSGRFDGRTIALRFYGLNAEFTRLQAAEPALTMATLQAMQYSGANENCLLSDNDPGGEQRTLAAPATSPTGTSWFAAELQVTDHFSEFYLTGPSAPLPVQLTQFMAQATGPQVVRLSWATAQETNSATFEVERSSDGQQFAAIGKVAAAGTSTMPRSYQLLDERLPAGAAVLYYRLRQVDQNGTAAYSLVQAVPLAGTGATRLMVYPNPARDGAATLIGAAPGTAVQLLDALGRPVLSATADAAGNVVLSLPTGLPAGMYVVRSGAETLRLVVE